jgi:uncharacterized membrane protein YhaH (DUF805 family)
MSFSYFLKRHTPYYSLFKGYFNTADRSSRREFFLYNIVHTLLLVTYITVLGADPSSTLDIPISLWLFDIIFFMPSLAIIARRLRDAGHANSVTVSFVYTLFCLLGHLYVAPDTVWAVSLLAGVYMVLIPPTKNDYKHGPNPRLEIK